MVESTSSRDGATRYVWEGRNGIQLDTVLLEHENKTCICVPSQVGCILRCAICMTGGKGFIRNLSYHEMTELVLQTVAQMSTFAEARVDRVLFNREGEALFNLRNFLIACRNLQSNAVLENSEFLVSTAGIVPQIYKLAHDKPDLSLWVSLNAPNNRIRSQLMPVNLIYGLEDLLQACYYYAVTTGKPVRLNYVLVEGVNDSYECALELSKIMEGRPFRLQIARMNPYAGLHSPTEENIHNFLAVLESLGTEVEYFESKGEVIGAGCGQSYCRS